MRDCKLVLMEIANSFVLAALLFRRKSRVIRVMNSMERIVVTRRRMTNPAMILRLNR
jgi:hypothetical protein